MRRKGLWILFFIAAVSFLALTAVHAVARELPPGDEPFRLTIPEGQEYTKPYGPIYGFPVLRLWGWSEDGKAALSVTHEVAGRGGAEVYYAVQDMKSDEVLWTLADDTFNWENEGADVEGFDLDRIAALSYERNKKAVNEAFDSHAIQAKTGTLLPFPLEWKGAAYTPKISIVKEKDPRFYDDIASYTVSLARRGGKTKKIASVDDTQSQRIYVCGGIMNPFEDRVAVVVAEERFVFEGTELFYSLVGCDLTKGF